MKVKLKDKSRVAIIVLSILVAISLCVTVYFAAFYATRTGSLTLSFADGLTMVLDPQKSGSGTYYYEITTADENSTTFTYPQWEAPAANVGNRLPTGDGVKATLNKDGYVSWKIQVQEIVSNNLQSIAGSWRKVSNNVYYFEPTGTNNDWKIELSVTEYGLFDISSTGSVITAIGNSKWTNSSLVHTLFTWIKVAGVSRRYYFDDLSGRTFKFDFTIKASTAAAPTF